VMDGKVIGSPTEGTTARVIARDLGTGSELWSQALTPPGAVGARTHAPVVSGGEVWAGYQSGTPDGGCAVGLVRLDLDSGAPLAEDTTSAPQELVPFGDRVALQTSTYWPSPVGDDCWPNPPTGVRVVDVASGATTWSNRAGIDYTVVVGDRLFTIAGSTLASYPASGCGSTTCTPTWSTTPAGTGSLAHLAGEASGPLMAVAPTESWGEHVVLAIDPTTGTRLGAATIHFNPQSLALAKGIAYIAGDAAVAAFDVASCATGTCEQVWAASLGGPATHINGLAVAGDVLYIGRHDGVVEAYAAAGCGAPECEPVTEVSIEEPVVNLVVSTGRLLVGSYDSVTAFAPTS
jgi:PQQ-like domain